MIIKNAKILNDSFEFQMADLVVGKKIERIIPLGGYEKASNGETKIPNLETEMDIIDLKGDLLIPGLVDIHTHGAIGIDVMADNLDYAAWAGYLAENGITTFVATTMTEDDQIVMKTLDNLKCAERVYLEGPHINAAKRGAHDKNKIKPLTMDYFDKIKDKIDIITIAPEIDGNMEMIKVLTSAGIRVAVGHSTADYETGKKAFANGATLLTHTFNAMNQLEHREPNLVGAALENENVFCEVISDGVHLHPAVVRILYKILGDKRMVLISDGMAATGFKDGYYKQGGLDIVVKEQIGRTLDGALAGSTTNLMGMVKKAVSFGIPMESAIRMASATPAIAAGLDNMYGSISVGKIANLVWCKEDLAVCHVIREGKVQYSSASSMVQ